MKNFVLGPAYFYGDYSDFKVKAYFSATSENCTLHQKLKEFLGTKRFRKNSNFVDKLGSGLNLTFRVYDDRKAFEENAILNGSSQQGKRNTGFGEVVEKFGFHENLAKFPVQAFVHRKKNIVFVDPFYGPLNSKNMSVKIFMCVDPTQSMNPLRIYGGSVRLNLYNVKFKFIGVNYRRYARIDDTTSHSTMNLNKKYFERFSKIFFENVVKNCNIYVNVYPPVWEREENVDVKFKETLYCGQLFEFENQSSNIGNKKYHNTLKKGYSYWEIQRCKFRDKQIFAEKSNEDIFYDEKNKKQSNGNSNTRSNMQNQNGNYSNVANFSDNFKRNLGDMNNLGDLCEDFLDFYRRNELFYVVAQNRMKDLKYLIEYRNWNIHVQDVFGLTVLDIALYFNNEKIVEKLKNYISTNLVEFHPDHVSNFVVRGPEFTEVNIESPSVFEVLRYDHSNHGFDFDIIHTEQQKGIIFCSRKGEIGFVDVDSGKCQILMNHNCCVFSVLYIPEKKKLMATDSNGFLIVINFSSNAKVQKIEKAIKLCEKNSGLWKLTRLSENCVFCCVGDCESSSVGSLFKINLSNEISAKELNYPSFWRKTGLSGIYQLQMNRNELLFFGKNVFFFNWKSEKYLGEIDIIESEISVPTCISSFIGNDEEMFISGSVFSHGVFIWNRIGILSRFLPHDRVIYSMAALKKFNSFFVGDSCGVLSLLNLENSRNITTIRRIHDEGIIKMKFNEKQENELVSFSCNGSISLQTINEKYSPPLRELRNIEEFRDVNIHHSLSFSDIIIFPDSNFVIWSTFDGIIQIFDIKKKIVIKEFKHVEKVTKLFQWKGKNRILFLDDQNFGNILDFSISNMEIEIKEYLRVLHLGDNSCSRNISQVNNSNKFIAAFYSNDGGGKLCLFEISENLLEKPKEYILLNSKFRFWTTCLSKLNADILHFSTWDSFRSMNISSKDSRMMEKNQKLYVLKYPVTSIYSFLKDTDQENEKEEILLCGNEKSELTIYKLSSTKSIELMKKVKVLAPPRTYSYFGSSVFLISDNSGYLSYFDFETYESRKIGFGVETFAFCQERNLLIASEIDVEKERSLKFKKIVKNNFIYKKEAQSSPPLRTEIFDDEDHILIDYSSKELQSDKGIVLEAVKQNGRSLQCASKELRSDKEIVLEAVKQDGWSLGYASKELQSDKEIVLEAVKQNGSSLFYASKELQSDKEIVLKAVKQKGWSLQFASKELRSDKEIVLEAVKQDGWSLQFASKEFQSDKEIVFEAVKQNGCSLKYASKELQSDKEIVLKAVKQDGWSLQFASKELRSDKEIVLEAVKEYGWSLQFASKELRSDKEFVLEAKKNFKKRQRNRF